MERLGVPARSSSLASSWLPEVASCCRKPSSMPVCRCTQKRKPASSVACWRGKNGPQGSVPLPVALSDAATTATTGSSSRTERMATLRPISIGSGVGVSDRCACGLGTPCFGLQRRVHFESLDLNQGSRRRGRSWRFSARTWARTVAAPATRTPFRAWAWNDPPQPRRARPPWPPCRGRSLRSRASCGPCGPAPHRRGGR